MDTGGWVRFPTVAEYTYAGIRQTPKGMVNIWKDTGAYQSLVPHVSHQTMLGAGRMHGMGYLGSSISVPTSAFDLSLAKLGVMGTGVFSSLAHVQALKSKSLLDTKSDYKLRFDQDILSHSISDTAQLSKQAQRQASLQAQELVSLSLLDFDYGTSSRSLSPHLEQIFPGKPYIGIFGFPFLDGKSRKRKKGASIGSFDDKYFYREFKVPKLKEVFKI